MFFFLNSFNIGISFLKSSVTSNSLNIPFLILSDTLKFVRELTYSN